MSPESLPQNGWRDAMPSEVEQLRIERDEMRRANVTPEDAARPLGQSVEYWQDRCLDHATALDASRVRVRDLEAEVERLRAGISWARGRCSDGEPHEEIDAYLGSLLDAGWGASTSRRETA